MSDVKYFQCFVCAKVFKSYSEMSEHVIKTHEEGREFIICPLPHCKAVVRDLRSHFKTKHKYNKLPKGCQLRCAVWFDVTSPKKKKKIISFKEGNMISLKNEGREVHYRSGWELKVYECLEKMDDVSRYSVEPFSVEYYLHGKRKHYFPDIKVDFIDNSVEIWEIKPANQSLYDINQAKWEACRKFCSLRGWKFKVIDEQAMKELNKL